MKIHSITTGSKRSAIEVKAQVDYESYELRRGPSTIKENNKFTIYKGKKTFDVLSYFDSLNRVFSERIKTLFKENKVTGIVFYPILIEGVKEKYYGYYITGKAGKITNLNEIGYVPLFEPIEFDITEWDGSDIFCFEDNGGHYFSEKVKNLLEDNKITNIYINDEN